MNPVYLREKGGWGRPNPFYDNLSRYSPFLIIGAILFGLCAGAGNPALFSANDGFGAFWCFLCLPAMLLNAISLFATLMAPALTAPSISMELDRGTWDLLRTTPLSTRSILQAKLLGALARLRIWRALLVLSLLQGIMMACSVTLSGGPIVFFGPLVGAAVLTRPWLEVLFAAIAGMYVSTRVRSATAALAFSYAVVLIFRLFNSTTVWMAVGALFKAEETLFLVGGVAPTVVYAAIITLVWNSLSRRVRVMNYD